MSRYVKPVVVSVLVLLELVSGVPIHVWGQPPDFAEEEAAFQQALQWIKQYRMAPVSAQIVDQSGTPQLGIPIQYTQVTHDFITVLEGTAWSLPNNTLAWSQWSNLASSTSAAVKLSLALWRFIEPQRGVFVWNNGADQAFQTILNHYPKARFVVMFNDLNCCSYARPAWIPFNALSNDAVFQGFKQDLYDYIYHVVQRYSNRVLYWETEAEYQKAIQVDQVMVNAIRAADPNAKVLLFVANPNFAPDPFTFAQEALRSGIKPDGISFEAYPGSGDTPLFIKDYMQELASLGLPVFLDGTGYPSQATYGCPWTPTNECFPAWNYEFGENNQALWHKYEIALAYGTPNVIGIGFPQGGDQSVQGSGLGQLSSTKDLDQWEYFGFFTWDGHPKQAYYTYQQLIQNFTTTGKAETNSTGQIFFRGFAGNYSITLPNVSTNALMVHVREGYVNQFVITLGKTPSLTSTYMPIPAVSQTTTTTVSFQASTSTESSQVTTPFTIALPSSTEVIVIGFGILVGCSLLIVLLTRRKKHQNNE